MDEKRKIRNRNFCCCCITHKDPPPVDSGDDGSFLKKISILSMMKYGVVPILRKRLHRLIIIVVFIILVIVGSISIQWLSTESESTRFLPDDSFAITYLEDLDIVFPSSSRAEISIILEDIDISDETLRNNVYSMIDGFESFSTDDAYVIGEVEQWLDDFSDYVNENYNNATLEDLDDNSDEFYGALQAFANDSRYAQWRDELLYDDDENPSKIRATKFYIQASTPIIAATRWPMRNDLNDVMKENLGSKKYGYTFWSSYTFAYFAYSVPLLTIRNIVSGSLGVFFVLCLMMDIKLAVFILFTVIMIDLDLFGWMVLCGVPLDSISFIQLVMAVGLTVDYVIHITHAIVDAELDSTIGDESGSDRDFKSIFYATYSKRIEISMCEMGAGVVKGAWTTFIGVFALAFSSSEAFRAFFALFAGIIVVALLHGVLFVPAILGELPWLFPKEDEHDIEFKDGNETEQENKDKEETPKPDDNERETETEKEKENERDAGNEANGTNKNETGDETPIETEMAKTDKNESGNNDTDENNTNKD